MKKIAYKIVIIITLVAYSILFVSCEAITAQNIKIDPNFNKNKLPGVGEEIEVFSTNHHFSSQ